MPSPFWPRDRGEPIPATKVGALGSSFNPTSLITGAGGFWRADMGTTLSGSNVTQWNDQTAFANNLTNGGTASNVTFSSTGFNTSFSAVQFADNANGNMKIAAGNTQWPATTTATMFMLLSPNTSTAGSLRWAWAENTANDQNIPAFTTYSNGINRWQPYSSGNQGNGGTALILTNGTPTLVGVVFDGAHANIWQNGSVVGSGTVFSSSLGGNSSAFGAGDSSAFAGAAAVGSHFAFWGITQKAMNTTDWTNLKNWCNSNWGTSF